MSQIDCITELTTYAKILYTMETRKIRIGLTIIIVVIIGIICAGKVCIDANNKIQKWKHQVLYEIECSSIDNLLMLSSAREDIRERWGIENDKWPLGSCHFIWGRMQQIFKDEYGIDWKSPAECESDAHYD